MTGNEIDFDGGGNSSGTVYGGERQGIVPPNAARNEHRFTKQRHQNHSENTGEGRGQENKYVHDTVVVREKRPRGGQDRTSTLGSSEGKMGPKHEGINDVGHSHHVHVVDMVAIPESMLPVNMVGQGYALDNGEINMDDEMGERAGREGSGDTLPGEGVRGVLKMSMDEGRTSTWSETKTKAGKERKRLPLACIACRRKKIRCSGEKPTCRHCLRSRIPCVYKQSTRKTAPRTDYMAMLDRRLKRMEERLIKNVPQEEVSAVLAVTGRSVVKPSLSTSSSRSVTSGKKRTAHTAFGGELDLWARSENVTKNQSGNVGLGIWGGSLTMKGGLENMDDGSRALPSEEIQEHLVEVFFEFVYGQPYFLLHKPSFMRRLRSGTAPPVLVLALCAVSARFSKHPAVRHDPPFLAGEGFATEARRLLLKNFDNPNITNVIVCLILGLHEFGTCQGGRSWAFGGMATRMAHALQLHKEVNGDPIGRVQSMSGYPQDHEGSLGGNSMSFIDREIRRRCMWASFVMDRFTSSGTERPCIISESELEIQLPTHDKNLELDIPVVTEQLDGTVRSLGSSGATENMGVGAYMVRVVALYGRVAKYFNQGGIERESRQIWDPHSQFAKLCAEADDFANTLPERLQYTTENAHSHATEHLFSQFVFIHIAFHQVRLFLQKSVMPATPTEVPGMPRDFAQSTSEITLNSATQIAKILEDVEERGAVVAAPFLGYCAFSAALIHLARMFSTHNSVQAEAKGHMEVCLRFLLQLRQYWGLFCYITDNLKRLYRKFSDADSSFSGHQETARMLQYGDWFQKYPQGVSANEYSGHTEKPQPIGDDNSSLDNAVLSQPSNLQTAEEFFAKLGLRSQRSTPSAAFLKRQAQPHTRASPVHTSAMMHGSSPASAHHSQSPAVYQSPATMEETPAITPTPSMVSGHGNIDLKLDPQSLSSSMLSHAPDTSSVNFEQSPQHHLSIPLLLPNIPSLVSFSDYPTAMSRTSAVDINPILTGIHQPHHHQDYFYDLYPAGSDPSTTGATTHLLNNGLWPTFDPPINLTDMNAFPDQTSSAWFLPFNSSPPYIETRVEDSMTVTGDDRGGGRGGGDEGGGNGGRDGRNRSGGVSHMISPTGKHAGLGASSGTTPYHDGVR